MDITLEQLAEGIRIAEAEGDSESVAILRAAYREMQQQQALTAHDLPVPGSPSLTTPPAPADDDYRQSYVGQGMSGAYEGVAQTLGFPVDGLNWLMGLGMSGINAVASTNLQPSAKPFGGSDMLLELLAPAIFEPSTDPGKQMVRRVGQDVGAMIPVGGPLSLLSKTPGRAFVAELISALTGGTAAAVTQQIAPGNKTAEATASLIGGFSPAAVAASLRRMIGTSVPTSLEALREAKIAAYGNADDLGVRYRRSAINQLGDTISTTAGQAINASGQILAKEVLDNIRKLGTKGNPRPTLGKLTELRQEVRAATNSADQGQAAIASLMLDDIDNFIGSAGIGAFKSKKPKQAGPTVEAALVANNQLRNSELITEVIQKAKQRAKNGASFNDAIRDEIGAIINDQRKSARFTPDERVLLQRVTRDGALDELFGMVGKLAPSDNQYAELFSMTAPYLHPSLGLLPAAGVGANMMPGFGTAAKLTKLQDAVQSGGPPVKRFALSEADKAALTAAPIVVAANQHRPYGGLATWLSRNGHGDLAAQLTAGKLTPRAAYEAVQRLRNTH